MRNYVDSNRLMHHWGGEKTLRQISEVMGHSIETLRTHAKRGKFPPRDVARRQKTLRKLTHD